MKKIFIALFCLLFLNSQGYAQTNFQSDPDVLQYLEGKSFSSSDGSLKIKIGYSGSLNSYGMIINGTTTHFNLNILVISPTSAIVTGESLSDPNGKLKVRINSKTDCLENSGSYYCLRK